jgi:hypothetical protein
MPAEALRIPMPDLLEMLAVQMGNDLFEALNPSADIPSPLQGLKDTTWIKTTNTVGINVRTIQHFWNIVPYALTLPDLQQSVHILPIWEPGVVASLYGPSSWNINPEFFSRELADAIPDLNTVEKQLKAVINILHLLGKTAGMDVVPHTDRYSEMVIANPRFFEWLQRDDLQIVSNDDQLFRRVEAKILDHVRQRQTTVSETSFPSDETAFFVDYPEEQRLRVLFGEKNDYEGRLRRRKEFVQLLYDAGLETVPATMGPPYRGLEVDPNPEACTIDEEGRMWRDYRITQPQQFSRAFGPLARYKLYESKNNNRDWELDFDRPNQPAWTYVCDHYRRIQAEYGFDFMRGDMSHVQMRPEGVPAKRDAYYDLLGAVKQAVLPEKPYFGYFAESFLAPPGEMAYGDECDHLEASFADTTLGDLQSEPVGTELFVSQFAQYHHWLETRQFAPNFTIMTADKDDPRFDSFYLTGNEIRYFIALFLTDMPSYMGLGFECRDPHPTPAPNEDYTKLYVFQMPDGPKGTKGPYQWGRNSQLYQALARQKHFANQFGSRIADARTRWLIAPDPTGKAKAIAWTQEADPAFVFVANLDTANPVEIDLSLPEGEWAYVFSTHEEVLPVAQSYENRLDWTALGAGEGRVLAKRTA